MGVQPCFVLVVQLGKKSNGEMGNVWSPLFMVYRPRTSAEEVMWLKVKRSVFGLFLPLIPGRRWVLYKTVEGRSRQ